jgi:leucyl-tRNA synthetase
MVKPMKVNLSKKNSERVLSSTKWIANAGQNYLASLSSSTKSTSTWKKLINALLLVPIIIPTAATIASIVCIYLFLNAVSAHKNDSKLSKILKFIARIFIYVVAAIILIPCIISNLMTSLIPALIFYYINRDFFNQKDTSIEVNEVKVKSEEEYKKRIKEEANKLEQQDDTDQGQPDIEVISRVMKDKQAVDRIVIV